MVLIEKIGNNLKASGMESKFEKFPLQLTAKQQWLGRQHRQFFSLSVDRGSTVGAVSFFHVTLKINFVTVMEGNVLRNMPLSEWKKPLLPNFCGICEGR